MSYSKYEYDDVVVPPPIPSSDSGGDDNFIPPLKPSNWVWQSVLVTLCCFPIFGIIGLVNGMQVNSLYYAGNYDRAEVLARRARLWAIVGLIVGVVYYVAMFITMMKGDFLNEIAQIVNDGAYSIYNY